MSANRIAAENCPQCGGVLPHGYGERITCPYCGSSLVRLQTAAGAPAAGGGPAAGAAAGAWGVRIKEAVCQDPKYGVPVFKWLIPAEWSFEGTVWWRNSVTMPAVIPFRAWNPKGAEQIECFPAIPNLWTEHPLAKLFGKWAPKQFLFKQDGLEQRAPLNAHQALRQLVIPRYRGTLAGAPAAAAPEPPGCLSLGGWLGAPGSPWAAQWQGLRESVQQTWRRAAGPAYECPGFTVRIAQEEELPDLAESLRDTQASAGGFAPPPSRDGARCRITYDNQGQPVEEDLFCVINRVDTQSGYGFLTSQRTLWTAEALFAFRAGAGHLDTLARSCMVSMRSFRMNPQWFQCYQQESRRIMHLRIQMTQALQQMAASQRQALAGLSQASRTMSETSDMIMDGWTSRSAAQDQMADNFSQAIRGVDTYTDSAGAAVELPAGYDQAWTNGLGEYLVTDSSFFDPNTDQAFNNQNWQTLQKPD